MKIKTRHKQECKLLISENDRMKQGVHFSTTMESENIAGFTNHLASGSWEWWISSGPLFFTWDLMEHSTVSRRGSQTPRDQKLILWQKYGSLFPHKKRNCNFFSHILTFFFYNSDFLFPLHLAIWTLCLWILSIYLARFEDQRLVVC